MVTEETPLLSIIIPAFNAEKTIVKCIKSILSQNYAFLDIIIVDDGSTDATAILCDELNVNYSNVRVIHQDNGGPNKARNTGIAMAYGEFIAFVDSDDEFYSNDTLSLNMQFFSKPNVDIVSFPQYREYKNHVGEILLQSKILQLEPRLLRDKKIILTNWFNGKLIDGHFPGKIFRKELFDGWNLIETIRFTEDHYNIPDLVDRCHAVQISGVGGYLYKYNENSAIHSEYTPFKRFGQLSSEIRLYSYLKKFSGVESYKNFFYFAALENAYYLIDTDYEVEALRLLTNLDKGIRFGFSSWFKTLLMVSTSMLGFRIGLKQLHKVLQKKSPKSHEVICNNDKL